MSDPAFVYETDIATSAERLWTALTTGELTRRYWFDRRIESDWRTGSPVRFYDGAGNVVTDSGVVLECDPPKRLVYTFRQEPGSGTTRVAFTIELRPDGRVRLLLVHDQLERPDDVDGWRQGWAPILANLRAFLDGGPATASGPADTADDTLLAAVRYRLAASPEAVYRALTEPDLIRRWWAPPGWTATVRELDLRPGGAFALTNVQPDGTPVELRGVYREVIPNRRLSHTFRALGDDRETVVSFDLRPDGDGTHLTFTEVGRLDDAGEPGDSEAGWLLGLQQLADLVESRLS
jgi:uncharacterized protein YndB with AHSA1/START domain